MEQRTPEWYKARLGHITSSMVYVLMSVPRKKDETFTDTAKTYLYGLAAERQMSPVYLNDHFDEWLERTDTTTRAMRYGTETEDLARQCYYLDLPDTQKVEERGFVEHIKGEYGDSPDGIVVENGKAIKAIEIKCPNSATYIKYKAMFAEGKSLKEVEEKYYWQCQSHMLCNDVQQCDFVFFDKMLTNPLQVVCVERNEDDIALMLERINLASEFIKNITDNAPPAEPKRVTCGECKHFVRDTTGRSYNNDTHEYFTGVCNRGLTPDGCKKVFANKPRICSVYINL